jgi:DNA polymerase-3 subunit alpha
LLAAESYSQGDVTLAGMITRVDRRIAKSSGNPWALVVLEDKDASIEVTFFSQAYMVIASELVEDLVVSIKGRVNEREGGITLMGKEMTVLNVSEVSDAGPPVTISLLANKVIPELALEMKKILSAHPGNTPVHLRLKSPGRNDTVMSLPDFPVTISSSLMGDLKGLLGASAVTL